VYANDPGKMPSNEGMRPEKTSLEVTSSAFGAGTEIPSEYTCDGTDSTPPLTWSVIPKDAKSIAILAEDKDAAKANFTHWLVTDIPASTTSLDAGQALPEGAMTAKNDKGSTGYTGPCPPTGRHHYVFHVYAIDKTIGKPTSRADFMQRIGGHVLAEGQLVGTYQKRAAR
jgi:hypothetical protein